MVRLGAAEYAGSGRASWRSGNLQCLHGARGAGADGCRAGPVDVRSACRRWPAPVVSRFFTCLIRSQDCHFAFDLHCDGQQEPFR